MLLPFDADLVRRDPAIPGLATILDADAFVFALRSSLPALDLGSARSTYVRYKPGTNCLIAYQLEVAGVVEPVYAKAFAPGAAGKLRKAREQPGAAGTLGSGRIVLEDCAVLVSTFPNDGKIRSLACMADARSRRGLFRELVPERPDLWEGAAQSLRYKPERRYVARLLNGKEPRAVIKVYTENSYRTAQHNAVAFASAGPLRLARLLGSSDHYSSLAFEWLPGSLLSDIISHPGVEKLAAGTNVGAALAELHAQDPGGLTHLSRGTEAAALISVAEGIIFLCPRLAKRVGDLARRVASRLMSEPFADAAIHGDLYAEQILLADDRVGMLDLDEAVRGDPAADLGNFIAHLECDVLRGKISPAWVGPLTGALLDGYRACTGRPVPSRVRLYTAAGLLRLAHHPFRQREPDWPARTEAITDRAEVILSGTENLQARFAV